MSVTQEEILRAASVAVVLGTRPEVVKLAGLIRLLGPSCRLIHTGQHYDQRMSRVFLAEFDVVVPDVSLTVGGSSRGRQIAETLLVLDDLFNRERPSVVIVQGDTNSTLGGALAANAHGIPLVHIESGMRSFDRRMAEEHNRVLADHLSEACCAPTEANAANLVREGILPERITVTGHTVVQAVTERLPGGIRRAEILETFGLDRSGYVMATFHRAENVDDPDHLDRILTALGRLSLPAVLPLHPRTRRRVEEFGLIDRLARLVLVEPLDYSTFLTLCAESALIVTDSGGVQVEATVYRRPLVVVRDTTEYPEIVGTFASLIPPDGDIVAEAEGWLEQVPAVHEQLKAAPSPYGEGDAAALCLEAVHRAVSA